MARVELYGNTNDCLFVMDNYQVMGTRFFDGMEDEDQSFSVELISQDKSGNHYSMKPFLGCKVKITIETVEEEENPKKVENEVNEENKEVDEFPDKIYFDYDNNIYLYGVIKEKENDTVAFLFDKEDNIKKIGQSKYTKAYDLLMSYIRQFSESVLYLKRNEYHKTFYIETIESDSSKKLTKFDNAYLMNVIFSEDDYFERVNFKFSYEKEVAFKKY